jgi:gluconolactonase
VRGARELAGTGLGSRYPIRNAGEPTVLDPAFGILDPRMKERVLGNVHIERIATGCRWCEGPVWFGDGRYLLWSDIPNNRIMRWSEETGAVEVFRQPANYTNGHTRDRQGRLVSCEHGGRRVSRTPRITPS